MHIRKNVLCCSLALAFVSLALSVSVLAQEKFPTKPVTIIVPFGPGGIIDVGTRIFADRFSKELGVPVIVDNRTGGAGLVGVNAFLGMKPDGYTLLSASGAATISVVLLSKTHPFDPRKDLQPIGYLADAPCAMSVAKNTPFKTFNEFLQFAKANPGKLKGGMSSLGGETHIMFESIIKEAKIDSKMVPYPATGGLVTAIMGGHLEWMCLSMPATMPYHKSGDVRIVLLTRRSPELPGVPSGADVGLPDISVNLWMGLFTHPKTPKPFQDRLASAVAAAIKDPEVGKKLGESGFSVAYRNSAEFSKLMDQQWDIFARVIKEANIKLD
jgi:tripartite-type tricarboxylate transporter receptor subunit TctC